MAPHRHLPGRPGGDDGEAREEGRLVYVSGKLQTRKWRKDGEDSDRFSTDILLVPGGRVQFLDKPNGNGAPAKNGDTMPSAETAATVDDSEIPF